jgi:hypothetical protein
MRVVAGVLAAVLAGAVWAAPHARTAHVAAARLGDGCASATQLIESAEGLRLCTYVDTTGHKTICYGFNLETGGAEAAVTAVGGNWDQVGAASGGAEISGIITPAVVSALARSTTTAAASRRRSARTC